MCFNYVLQEKEVALRGNKGPIEASQVAMKDLRLKLRKAIDRAEDETKKRTEMQKTLVSRQHVIPVEHCQFPGVVSML